MANYGYTGNAPSYGYMTARKPRQPMSPYYAAATLQGEPKNQAPFTTLASGTATAPTTKPPGTAQGYLDAAGHPIAQTAIEKSLAANPNASKGDYQGPALATDQTATPAGVTYDYKTDPVLQQILATGVTSRAGAEANALAAKKQLALQYGDTALAGQIGDTATAGAAGANPYGVFTMLKKNYDLNAHNADEGYNAANLFYGGARELGQKQIADQYGTDLAGQTANEQGALGAVEQNRLAQILGADQADITAKNEAVSRAIQTAQQNGWSFGGFDNQGNPIYTQPNGGGGGGGGGSMAQPHVNIPSGNGGTPPLSAGGSTVTDPLAAALTAAAYQKQLKQARQENPLVPYTSYPPPPGWGSL